MQAENSLFADPLILPKRVQLAYTFAEHSVMVISVKNSSAFPVTGAQVSQAKQIGCRNNNSVIKQQLFVSSTLPVLLGFLAPLQWQKDTRPEFTPAIVFFPQLNSLISIQSSIKE